MGFFSRGPEILGQLTVGHDGGVWTLGTDLSPPLFALTLPHYFERVLHNSDADIATAFVAGLRDRLEGLIPDNDTGRFLASGGSRVLFEGFREWGAPTWKFSVAAQLGRKRDSSRFLNQQLYFALTEWTPQQLTQQDLAHTLVPLYERALALPPPISLLTSQILRVQVLIYTQNGPPTTAMLGAAPNVAVRSVFEAACDGNVEAAEQAFSRYVAGQFSHEAPLADPVPRACNHRSDSRVETERQGMKNEPWRAWFTVGLLAAGCWVAQPVFDLLGKGLGSDTAGDLFFEATGRAFLVLLVGGAVARALEEVVPLLEEWIAKLRLCRGCGEDRIPPAICACTRSHREAQAKWEREHTPGDWKIGQARSRWQRRLPRFFSHVNS